MGFLLRGEGCDTPSVTIVAIVFLQYIYSVTCNIYWLKVQIRIQTLPLNIYLNQVIFTTCKGTPNS
jgi:hypothetical protein